MRQLSASDWTMVAIDTPQAHNTIGLVGIYDTSTCTDGPPDYDEVLSYIEARLHVAESFRERILHVPLGLDRPYWIRDGDFDLEYHVRQIALPRPGSWRQFCTQIARIHARPLDLSRPPWELYLIDGLDGIDHVPDGFHLGVPARPPRGDRRRRRCRDPHRDPHPRTRCARPAARRRATSGSPIRSPVTPS